MGRTATKKLSAPNVNKILVLLSFMGRKQVKKAEQPESTAFNTYLRCI